MRTWMIISVIVILAVLGLLAALIGRRRGQQREPDYYQFFVMGIVWVPVGVMLFVSTRNPGLLGMGVIFLIVGLVNRSKWEKNRRRFADLTVEEKRLKLAVVLVLTLALLAGVIAYMMSS